MIESVFGRHEAYHESMRRRADIGGAGGDSRAESGQTPQRRVLPFLHCIGIALWNDYARV